MLDRARLTARFLANWPSSTSSASQMPHTQSGPTFSLGSAAYTPGVFPRPIPLNGHSQQRDSRQTAGEDPFAAGWGSNTPLVIPNNARVRYTSTPSHSYPETPDIHPQSGLIAPGATYHMSYYAQTQHDVPPHLVALNMRMTEPGALQGIVDRCDTSARSRQGQGLGINYPPFDKQAIPEHNRVFPERILSGESGWAIPARFLILKSL